jgi:hypothetical protein
MNELIKSGDQMPVLSDDLLEMGGMGSENVTSKNIVIPRLVILQALSPQVNKKKAEFIEGSEVSDFCNVATGDLYKEAVYVIPCYFITNYLEWGKNRSGLANNFGDNDSILQKCVKNEKGQNILPSGNEVQETAQWYCLLSPNPTGPWERVFFPLKQTGLKHSRKWLTLIQAERVMIKDKAGKEQAWKPPLFWRIWKLSIVGESNDQGDWYTFKPEKKESVLELDPEQKLLNMCKSFYSDLKTNKVRGDIESSQSDYQGNGKHTGNVADADIPF